MKSIIIFICIFWFVFLFGLIVGEKYVSSRENTRFGKWWRKNICAPDPYEN